MKYTMDADLLKLIKKDTKNQKVCSPDTIIFFVVTCMVFSGEVFIYNFFTILVMGGGDGHDLRYQS
jgi:hypothetical protein